MVEAGELKLIGTLDTTDIERGQRRVQVGFDNVEQKTKASVSGFDNLGGSATKLIGAFAAIGTVGVGAISALALKSPQAAGALASMRASTQQLSIELGEQLSPTIDNVASAYANFVDSVGTEGTFANSALELVGSIFQGIGEDISDVIDFVNKLNNLELPSWMTVGDEPKTLGSSVSDYIKKESEEYKQGFLGNVIENAYNVLNPSNAVLDFSNNFLGTNFKVNNPITMYRQIRSDFYTTDTTGANMGE